MEKLLQQFRLNDEQLHQVYVNFSKEIERGLARKTHAQADIKCFITYLQRLPTGMERGQFMALDLGGTNFRVMLVTLKGNEAEPEVQAHHCKIPKHIMLGKGKQLFDYIAASIATFVAEKSIADKKLPLGFTFSFPCAQQGLDKAVLVRWTKGFNCADVVQQDVVQLLKEALIRRDLINIHVIAIVNDTIGTLMSCAHLSPACRIALIVGTGCNACYVEKSAAAELLEDEYKAKSPHIIINTEWGAFGESGGLDFVRTESDKIIDDNSINKGKQLFEKMISGLYLGELLRLLLLKATGEELIFNDAPNHEAILDMLTKPQAAFKTKLVSTIEGDDLEPYTATQAILKEYCNVKAANVSDCQKVKLICEVISRRSAALVAVGLSCLINRIDEAKIVVGVDGAVYRHHPKFDGYVREVLKKFIKPDKEFDIITSEDGSGRGAALVAAVASQDHNFNSCLK